MNSFLPIMLLTFSFLLYSHARALSPGTDEALRSADDGLMVAGAAESGSPAPSHEEQRAPVPEEKGSGNGDTSEEGVMPEEEEEPALRIADPLQPWNKAMFHFNDRFYFWLYKPVTQGYKFVVPEDFRVAAENLYGNLHGPVRIVNNLLQLKLKNSGNEFLRFVINTTIGFFGMADVAKEEPFGIKEHEEDFDQTLGSYGIGHGIYIVWPILGPSSLRDSAGRVGDWFAYPLGFYSPWSITSPEGAGIYAHEKANDLSFKIGDYEAFKKAAIDPYISMRDAFLQNRKKEVEK